VILVPIAVGFVVMLQFEIAFFKLYLFRHKETVIVHIGDSENYPTFPNKMSSAREFLPAEPYPKNNRWVLVVIGHRRLASPVRLHRPT
jgi:hypothetical protein